MINETINQTGVVSVVAQIVAQGGIDLMKDHNIAFVIMAFIGMVAVIGAVGDKLLKAFQYIFLICIGIPAIIVLGLINKKERKNRLKDLGDIKAHLKKHPEKWKIVAFYALCAGFVGFMLINMLLVYWRVMV